MLFSHLQQAPCNWHYIMQCIYMTIVIHTKLKSEHQLLCNMHIYYLFHNVGLWILYTHSSQCCTSVWHYAGLYKHILCIRILTFLFS